MRPRSALRGCVAIVSAGALLTPSVARADQPRHADEARIHGRIVTMLRHMTLREKVGQLFVVEVYGQEAGTAAAGNRTLYGVDTPAQVIDKYKPGGVIYFDARRGPDNVRDPRQIATLSNGLQAAALRQRTRIPLLISTDQEGGAVVYRLTAPATAMPGAMALGAGRSTADARRSAEVIGTEPVGVFGPEAAAVRDPGERWTLLSR